jgi:hypothetical protein
MYKKICIFLIYIVLGRKKVWAISLYKLIAGYQHTTDLGWVRKWGPLIYYISVRNKAVSSMGDEKSNMALVGILAVNKSTSAR